MTDTLEKILAVERLIQKNPLGITTKQIIEKLKYEYGINAGRNGIYRNISALTRFMPIYSEKREGKTYWCLQRSNSNER